MCGRYGFIPGNNFYIRFGVSQKGELLKPIYNVAPGMTMPIIAGKELRLMKWGFIPSWAKDPKIGYKMINARSETLKEKQSFRSSLYTKRCLVPVSGFYEWEKQGKEKVPYYYRLKDKELFAFAGLYDNWKNEKGEDVEAYTIITTEANKLVGKIHERMPAILKEEGEKAWLDQDEKNIDKLLGSVKPYAEKDMEVFKVSDKVNSTKNEGPELIESQE
jgi:putative SOS response-associated peptidase YedK